MIVGDTLCGCLLVLGCIVAQSTSPVTEVEKFTFETSGQEDMSTWKSWADVLPKREYTDITDEEPDGHECELPDLPPQPDSSTTTTPLREE